jgi:hypothetical protein
VNDSSAVLAGATSSKYCWLAALVLIAPDIDEGMSKVAIIITGTTVVRFTHSPRIARISEC